MEPQRSQDQPRYLVEFFVYYDVVPLRPPRAAEAIRITIFMFLVLRTNWLIQGVKLVALCRGCGRYYVGLCSQYLNFSHCFDLMNLGLTNFVTLV